jgi:CDP-paratose 2-epimerase
MKVIITGGCGFLGSNIAASYLEEGAEVIIIDALFRQGGQDNLEWLNAKAKPAQLTHYNVDFADDHAVNEIFKKHSPVDYVCHLGGQVAMTISLSDPRRDFRTNALGTFNVLEAVRAYSPEAMLAYSSTNKVYGDLEHLTYIEGESRYSVPAYPHGFDESLRLDFASPYGCSKGAADQYVRDWHRNFGLKTVIFRHSSIYGGRQFATFDQGWIGWFCQKALEQKKDYAKGLDPQPFTIAGTGKQVRDVLHADDLIRLYRAAYQHRDQVAGEIFNIGGGAPNSLSLLELFALLQELLDMDKPMLYRRLPRRQSDQDFFVANILKAEAHMAWKPDKSARIGIGHMLEWVSKKNTNSKG